MILTFSLPMLIAWFWHLDMAHNQCTPIIPITLGAIVGSLFIFSISQRIDDMSIALSKVNQYIGRNTFVILAFSQVIIMTINKYWQLNGILKYGLLAIVLFMGIVVKNRVINIWKGSALNN